MSGGFVGGFVIGVIIGAALVLVAVARRGTAAVDLVAQGVGQVRDRAGGLIDRVRQVPAVVGVGRVEANGQTAPAIEREIDERADQVIHTAAGMQ